MTKTITKTKGDKAATLTALTDLGVMSRFESKMFEQFLDLNDANDYITFILALKYLKTLQGTVIDVDDTRFITNWAKQEQLTLKSPTEAIMGTTYPAYIPEIKKLDQLVQLNGKLIEKLAKRVKALENKAKDNSTSDISNDGTHFKYSERNNYFTSIKEHEIYFAVKIFHKSRLKKDNEITALNPTDASAYLKKSWYGKEPDFNYDYIKNTPKSDEDMIKCTLSMNLDIMNKRGYVVKEQCLTFNELEGKDFLEMEPACLKGIEWRGASGHVLLNGSKKTQSKIGPTTLIIHDLFIETKGENLNSNNEGEFLERLVKDTKGPMWAYYPTLALLVQIDLALIQIQSDIITILGKTTQNDALTPSLNKLLWVKMVANARIEQLKKIAFNRAFTGNVHNIKSQHQSSKMALVWDETKYKPAEKKKGLFVNKAGENDIEVTECALISDGVLMWVRTPCWYLPVPTHKKGGCLSLGHVELTERATIISPKTIAASTLVSKGGKTADKIKGALKTTKDTTLADIINGIKNPKLYTSVDLKGLIDKYDSVFWKADYHYEGGFGPYGTLPAYAVGGEFQLMRFASSTEGSLNMTFDQLKDLKGKMGINKQASLTLLSAQASFMTWLPLETNKKENETNILKVSGWEFSIPYFIRGDNHTKYLYPVGEFLVKLSASVHGLAALSCQLSSELRFGPADNETGVGIRGCSFQYADYNVSSGTADL